MVLPSFVPLAVTLSLLLASVALAQEHREGALSTDEKLGAVSFSTSCNAAAQPLFNRAVALLHSFEFKQAIEGFNAALKSDPSCAMSEWGIALSRWGNPFVAGLRPPAPLQQGRDAVSRARRIGLKTGRERAYVDAVSQLYASFETIDQRTRMLAYRDAMAGVAESNADDIEASIFYALSIAAAAAPADKMYADLLKSGAILEKLAASQPNHPGLSHYIIHSDDVPPLAKRALDSAWCYSKIAPSAPHALHMPSHTFTRLGYWQESIDANIASGAVAKREGSTAEELHTLDYRAYAYLQTAQDGAARGILDALTTIEARLTEKKEAYWAEQTEIQRRSASAWLALAEGRSADALVEMRAAAAMEDGTEKSAVTPGPLAPARELVGEMLLQMDQPANALREFEATLAKEPNRFRAMFGAARSASLAGDREKARTYSAALLKVSDRADEPGRPELEQARRMASNSQ